jgi:NAD(P)-dependent dehydrogenase (short-subunit alcohol dehydrogenase family)
VSNAGSFSATQRIEAIDDAAWERSLALNLTSHLKVLRAAAPFLALGVEASVVVVASRNVPAPGPGAAAYSVAKAGLTQLARVAALEMAAAGVRVNVLHPDKVWDTGLWTDEVIAQRAASYGVSVEAYRKQNLLRTEVATADVAEAALALVRMRATTGAQVAVDGGSERVV